jgi:hypothetical protein
VCGHVNRDDPENVKVLNVMYRLTKLEYAMMCPSVVRINLSTCTCKSFTSFILITVDQPAE